MKKALSIVLTIIIFLFSSCSQKQNIVESSYNQEQIPTSLNKGFDATAKVKTDKLETELKIKKSSSNNYEVEILQPQSLKGMKLKYDGNNFNVSYGAINADIPKNSFITSAIVNSIIESIEKASNKVGISISNTPNGFIIKNESENGKFELLFSKDNGSALKLSIPSLNLECTFNNFEYNKS